MFAIRDFCNSPLSLVSTLAIVLAWTTESIDSNPRGQRILVTIIFASIVILIFLIMSYATLSIIEMDENGISSSLYKIFRKRKMTWAEVKHILQKSQGYLIYLFISKKNMSGKSLGYRRWNKDTVTLVLSKEALLVIREYTSIPIEGVTKEQENQYITFRDK